MLKEILTKQHCTRAGLTDRLAMHLADRELHERAKSLGLASERTARSRLLFEVTLLYKGGVLSRHEYDFVSDLVLSL